MTSLHSHLFAARPQPLSHSIHPSLSARAPRLAPLDCITHRNPSECQIREAEWRIRIRIRI